MIKETTTLNEMDEKMENSTPTNNEVASNFQEEIKHIEKLVKPRTRVSKKPVGEENIDNIPTEITVEVVKEFFIEPELVTNKKDKKMKNLDKEIAKKLKEKKKAKVKKDKQKEKDKAKKLKTKKREKAKKQKAKDKAKANKKAKAKRKSKSKKKK